MKAGIQAKEIDSVYFLLVTQERLTNEVDCALRNEEARAIDQRGIQRHWRTTPARYKSLFLNVSNEWPDNILLQNSNEKISWTFWFISVIRDI